MQSLRSVVFLQIFFHYSELAEAAESDLIPGTSVEFVIQNRQVLCMYMCVYQTCKKFLRAIIFPDR